MDNREKRAAEDAIRAACPDQPSQSMPWDGKNPTSKVSAIIYIVSQLHPDPERRMKMEDIANVAGENDASNSQRYNIHVVSSRTQ